MHRQRACLWLVALLLALLGGPWPSAAQSLCPSPTGGWTPLSFQTLTVSAVAVAQIDVSTLPQSLSNIAMALLTVENATLRFRFDADPTDTAGHELAAGVNFVLCGRQLITAWRGIRTSTGQANALVRISLFAPM